MLFIPKIDDYLKILTDDEVKDFVVPVLYSKLCEKQNIRKLVESLYIFLPTPDEEHTIKFNQCNQSDAINAIF